MASVNTNRHRKLDTGNLKGYTTTMPAKKTTTRKPAAKPRAHGGGRPVKGTSAAAHVMSLRFADDDWTMLEDLVIDQEAKVEALGVTSFSAADMVRFLIREEHKRRGLGHPI